LIFFITNLNTNTITLGPGSNNAVIDTNSLNNNQIAVTNIQSLAQGLLANLNEAPIVIQIP
jgi:hypothetical protein